VHQWPDRESPIARLTGLPVPIDKHNHVFGAYCLFHVPKENRAGAFHPPSEMGIWVGNDPHVKGGHWVVPIHWDVEQQCWVLEAKPLPDPVTLSLIPTPNLCRFRRAPSVLVCSC
jgi:hypothetical protein